MTVKYRIELMESDRHWGLEYWHEYYDTYEEAKKRIEGKFVFGVEHVVGLVVVFGALILLSRKLK